MMLLAFPEFSVGGFQFPLPIMAQGLITGMTYGLLGVGLVLVYRSSRVINFAHGAIGAVGATVLGILVARNGLPFWPMVPIALLLAAGVGFTLETAVVRRLRRAPKLMTIIATLGFGEALVLIQFAISGRSHAAYNYPEPPGFPPLNLFGLIVTPSYTAMLILTPAVILGLTVFMRRSRMGIAIRGAADNPDAAFVAGIPAARMSGLAWGIAGSIAAFTAILIFPTQGFITAATFGPSFLLRALVAAVVARLDNFPIAFTAGMAVGVIEQLLLWNFDSGGAVDATLFVLILVALFVQPKIGGRIGGEGNWGAVEPWRPLPQELRKVRLVRQAPWIALSGVFLLTLPLPFLISTRATLVLVTIFAFSIAGLSLRLLTGLAGQVSLGQFALAGFGALIAALVGNATGNYTLAVLLGGAAAAVTSLVIGAPALRIRGLMLAVTTLAFALATQNWLLQQPWALGAGLDVLTPRLGPWELGTTKHYYYFALAWLLIAYLAARNLDRSGLRRIFVAVRDNEDAARAFGLHSSARKLQAFALAGFLAGIAGAVDAFALTSLGAAHFTVDLSINVAAMAVIGGIGILMGPIIGAFYIFGVPGFVPLDAAGLAASAAGWVIFVLYFPSGFAGLLRPIRDRFVKRLTSKHHLNISRESEDETISAPIISELAWRTPKASQAKGTILGLANLTKNFGGILAVDDVSLNVAGGETVGLIGPNGAGKTTLFEIASGFIRPDAGSVTFEGKPFEKTIRPLGPLWDLRLISGPEERTRRGLVRSFQNAALFPTMTVRDVLMLAQERLIPTTFGAAVMGSPRQEEPKEQAVIRTIETMGLDSYAAKQIQELSTGTRRIVELGCLLALRPRLLLLDEPSSGIAQRETEALGNLLLDIKDKTSTTMVVIEHDIPMVMQVSDRIIAMESGRIIADGPPDEVREDPEVVRAYLGLDATVIERSGPVRSRT